MSESSGEAQPRDEFVLYDLEVVVERIDGHCTCAMTVGDRVFVRGGKLSLPEGADFCLYALQSTLPLIPAKQRRNHPADWLESDARVHCPDPACGLIMRIDRVARRTLRHDDVSATPWEFVDRHSSEQEDEPATERLLSTDGASSGAPHDAG